MHAAYSTSPFAFLWLAVVIYRRNRTIYRITNSLFLSSTEVQCPNVGSIEHGSVVCTDGRDYKSSCKYKCNRGYKLDGDRSFTCSTKGKWEPQPQASCSKYHILCDLPYYCAYNPIGLLLENSGLFEDSFVCLDYQSKA